MMPEPSNREGVEEIEDRKGLTSGLGDCRK